MNLDHCYETPNPKLMTCFLLKMHLRRCKSLGLIQPVDFYVNPSCRGALTVSHVTMSVGKDVCVILLESISTSIMSPVRNTLADAEGCSWFESHSVMWRLCVCLLDLFLSFTSCKELHVDLTLMILSFFLAWRTMDYSFFDGCSILLFIWQYITILSMLL